MQRVRTAHIKLDQIRPQPLLGHRLKDGQHVLFDTLAALAEFDQRARLVEVATQTLREREWKRGSRYVKSTHGGVNIKTGFEATHRTIESCRSTICARSYDALLIVFVKQMIASNDM